VSGLPAWIRASVIVFVVCKVQFNLVISLFAPLAVNIFLKSFRYIILDISRQNRVRKLINLDIQKEITAVGCGPGADYP